MLEDETGEEPGCEPEEDGGYPEEWQVVYPAAAARAGWWEAIDQCAVTALTVWKQQGVRALTHQFEHDGFERVWRTELCPSNNLWISAQAPGAGNEFVLEWVLERLALRPFWLKAQYAAQPGNGCFGEPDWVPQVEAA